MLFLLLALFPTWAADVVVMPVGRGDPQTASGVNPWMPAAGMPRKVALISFYIHDPGTFHSDQTASSTRAVNNAGASHFATRFAHEGIEPMRTAFAEHGVTLLTPDAFADTEAKQRAWDRYAMELGFLGRTVRSVYGKLENAARKGTHVENAAAAQGYRYVPTVQLVPDKRLYTGLATLARELEVDAVLVVETRITTGPRAFLLSSVTLDMLGPNPLPRPAKTPKIAYWDGQQYGRVEVPGHNRRFARHRGKVGIEDENYSGYTELIIKLTDALCDDLAHRVASADATP